MSPGNHLVDEHLWVLWTYGWFPFLLGWIPACLCIFVGSGFKSQDHALLIGSIGLLVALGSTMYLTYGMHRRAPCFPIQPTT